MGNYKIDIDSEEIEKRLKEIFMKKHEKVAEVIMGIIGDREHDLNLIFRATLGLYPDLKYKEGDMILVHAANLPTWRFNEDATQLHDKYYQQGYIKCTIKSIHPYRYEPYQVEFLAISEDKEVSLEGSIMERHVQGYQEIIPKEVFTKYNHAYDDMPPHADEVDMDEVI